MNPTMTTMTEEQQGAALLGADKNGTSNAEAGGKEIAKTYRTLHCLVPSDIFWHARRMAVASKMPFKEYVAAVLRDSRPFQL